MFVSATVAPPLPWYDIPWQDWLGIVFALVGFPLTLYGLYLTWKQAREAKTAADQAKAAVEATQRKLRAGQLLVLIPQLRWIAQVLEESIDLDEPLVTRKHLDNWRWSASNVRGIIASDDAIAQQLLEDLQESVTLAFTANTALAEGKRPVMVACKRVRASISSVCVELTTWAGSQSLSVDAEGANENAG